MCEICYINQKWKPPPSFIKVTLQTTVTSKFCFYVHNLKLEKEL